MENNFKGHEVSLVQNFLCTMDFRLKQIETLIPQWAETLNPYPVIVNYDSEINIDKVYSLYSKYFTNLYFQQDLKREWRGPVMDLLNMTDSPYILMICEDYLFEPELTRKRFLKILDEYKTSNCSHLQLTKVHNYSEAKWHSNSHKGEELWTFPAKKSPYPLLPAAGLFKKDLYIDSLKNAKGFGLKGLDAQEKSGIRHRDIICACLTNKLIGHGQPEFHGIYGGSERLHGVIQ